MSHHVDAAACLDLLRRRWACKLFDGQALGEDAEAALLEAGRLAPSSFGLEPWLFVANRVDSPAREAFLSACFAQDSVRTAGLVVAILVRRAGAYDPDGAFVRERSERFPGGHPVFRADFSGYYDFLKGEGRLEEWARAQAYLACASMMTEGTALGLDSCAIEGYKEEAVLAAAGADPETWRVGIVVVFGKAGEAVREKIREPLTNLVRYV